MKKLLSIRKRIDTLDARILKILQKRYALVMEITMLKYKKNLPIEQPAREQSQFKNIKLIYGKDKELQIYIQNIFKFILRQSRNIQKRSLNNLQKLKKMIK